MPGLSFYGLPGYIDMPSAYALPDGTFAFSVNQYGDVRRGNLVFQISPRITGAFRYAYMEDFDAGGRVSRYDRSFDLRWQVLTEDQAGWRPAVSVGLQDFGGSGIFAGEYLVASKRFGTRVTASTGIGWGRLGSYGSFSNPLSLISDRFDTRPGGPTRLSEVGRIEFGSFFRGDAALFAGIDWQVSDRLRLSAEYSSDAMSAEVRNLGFERRTPINLSAEYQFNNGARLALAVLYGSEVGLNYSFPLNPARPPSLSGREPGPPAVSYGSRASLASWGLRADGTAAPRDRLAEALRGQGARLEGFRIDGETAIVDVSNLRWKATGQFLGRTARILSAELPSEVRQFRIRTDKNGMTVNDMVIRRSDLEELEFAPDGAWQAYVRSGIQDASLLPDPRLNRETRFDIRIRPYFDPSLFDPDNPLRLDFGAAVTAEWSPLRGLYFGGSVRQKLIGNLDESTRMSNTKQQHVRSDGPLYAKTTGPKIPWMTVDYFARPGDHLYSRATAGLLEPMFGGVSGELLWAPADRNYALGIEVNYARQRDFEGGFGFQDYDIITGHLSGYYDFGNGYEGQMDVGRYLAGDWGTTISFNRRFGNGFMVGAFFTLTDIPFDDFGEGSFDKGIVLSVPVTWLTGKPSRQRVEQVIRPILRDGGARLQVRNRLYELTRDDRDVIGGESWGRFWR